MYEELLFNNLWKWLVSTVFDDGLLLPDPVFGLWYESKITYTETVGAISYS